MFEGHLADEAKISLTWDIETQVLLLARVADPDPVFLPGSGSGF